MSAGFETMKIQIADRHNLVKRLSDSKSCRFFSTVRAVTEQKNKTLERNNKMIVKLQIRNGIQIV